MSQVFKPYSRLTVPYEDVVEYVETGDFPDGIKDLNFNKRMGKLLVQSVPEDDSIGPYTPSAALRAKKKTTTVAVDDDGEVTHLTPATYKGQQKYTPEIGEEESIEITDVEYLRFYGYGDGVLINKILRKEMFDVLCELSQHAVKGYVQGVIEEDGELEPIRLDAGEGSQDACLQVVEEGNEDERIPLPA